MPHLLEGTLHLPWRAAGTSHATASMLQVQQCTVCVFRLRWHAKDDACASACITTSACASAGASNYMLELQLGTLQVLRWNAASAYASVCASTAMLELQKCTVQVFRWSAAASTSGASSEQQLLRWSAAASTSGASSEQQWLDRIWRRRQQLGQLG